VACFGALVARRFEEASQRTRHSGQPTRYQGTSLFGTIGDPIADRKSAKGRQV
jgi:hypothetical protein